jgi:acetyl-CoA acyltransferase
MRDAVIVEAVRTPVGRRKGTLAGVHPVDLSALVLTALAERSGIDPALVDDVVWGCVSQVGEQSWNIARNAVLAAGWPESVPGTSIDRQCGSSQQALHFAAAAVVSGQCDVVVAGGVEAMTRVPMGSSVGHDVGTPFGPQVLARYDGVEGVTPGPLPFNQGVGAELIAQRYGFGRTQLDEYALASHAKAAAAQDAGLFADEIVPVPAEVLSPGRESGPSVEGGTFDADEGIRRDTSLAKLGELPTPFRPDGVVTAGSASQISDGSAALLVTTSEKARELGLTPIARVYATALAAADPVLMLTAPMPATEKVLAKAGLGIDDIGVFEVNEAFAPVPLAWLKDTGADPERVNPRGGAIALGHPLGGSGARLMTTLLGAMRAGGHRYGLQTMCEGGGMANATVLELLGS